MYVIMSSQQYEVHQHYNLIRVKFFSRLREKEKRVRNVDYTYLI